MTNEEALEYHQFPRPGKVAVVPTKACQTARDLSLAYSPGVAVPCLEIERDPRNAYRYTSKGNLVAVISNGSAVLGLGNIGALAGKPVMEGKGVLFKTFADIDVFDLELNCADPEKFVETVVAVAPTFGGINLEDIKAPECFYIETELKRRLDIPVFHDDQHGTAIIAGAALLNALDLSNRNINDITVVVSGAGAAAIACANLLFELGARRDKLLMVDSKGVIYRGRTEGMNEFKAPFAVDTSARTLAEALQGADVFFGLSAKDLVTPEMLRTMAKDPIVFAMANPDPEIDYDLAKQTRSDVIMATGRSDFPNQVNNVLGFPYIFRGALDVHASSINEAMKMAAVRALAALARESVHESVHAAYQRSRYQDKFSFGREYLIPKPFDPRVLYSVAPAVAEAAIKSGVARQPIDIEEYTLRLKGKQNRGRVMIRGFYEVARRAPSKRIVFAEGANEKVLKAAVMALDEHIAQPVLIGTKQAIAANAERLEIDISRCEIIDPDTDRRSQAFVERYHHEQHTRGVTRIEAERAVRQENIFANMLLASGEVDGLICGVDRSFPEMMRPLLRMIGLRPGITTAAALYLLSAEERLYFLADTAVNIEMTSEKLANIAIMTAEFAKSMDIEPRVALLSFSNFGSVSHPAASMIRQARSIIERRAPDLAVDGEMQADTAVDEAILSESYPFSRLKQAANVLVFPDMQSGNIAFKLLQRLGGAKAIGPVILGLRAPAYIMQRHTTVDEIFNMITIAAGQANLQEEQPSFVPHLANGAIPARQHVG